MISIPYIQQLDKGLALLIGNGFHHVIIPRLRVASTIPNTPVLKTVRPEVRGPLDPDPVWSAAEVAHKAQRAGRISLCCLGKSKTGQKKSEKADWSHIFQFLMHPDLLFIDSFCYFFD